MENKVYFMKTNQPDLSAAAYMLLERALGFAPAISRNAHGKPYLPEHPQIQFNLSHTKGAVVCALSGAPVGIDVEHHLRPFRHQLALRYFTPQEIAYATDPIRRLEIWTRKEALLKRHGNGISIPLNQLETMEHTEITTVQIEGFILSFCGTPPEYQLVQLGAF